MKHKKIAIIGAGAVGSTTAYALMLKNIIADVAVVGRFFTIHGMEWYTITTATLLIPPIRFMNLVWGVVRHCLKTNQKHWKN